jgi:hypothetical protein
MLRQEQARFMDADELQNPQQIFLGGSAPRIAFARDFWSHPTILSRSSPVVRVVPLTGTATLAPRAVAGTFASVIAGFL